jgi:hypothetical protein
VFGLSLNRRLDPRCRQILAAVGARSIASRIASIDELANKALLFDPSVETTPFSVETLSSEAHSMKTYLIATGEGRGSGGAESPLNSPAQLLGLFLEAAPLTSIKFDDWIKCLKANLDEDGRWKMAATTDGLTGFVSVGTQRIVASARWEAGFDQWCEISRRERAARESSLPLGGTEEDSSTVHMEKFASEWLKFQLEEDARGILNPERKRRLLKAEAFPNG